MLKAIKRLVRATTAFVKRLIIAKPNNEYEGIVFTALQAAAMAFKRGLQA